MKKDDATDGDVDMQNSLPSQLGAFLLSNINLNMYKLSRRNNSFYNKSIYYGDTDSLYIGKKIWDVLDVAGLVGSELCQGRKFFFLEVSFMGCS